jgi:hypothetical protein
LWRATAALPLRTAAAHRSAGVAVLAVSEELLSAATLVTGAESVSASRLANREIGILPLGRRLALGTRERGANQRPMNRTVLARISLIGLFGSIVVIVALD